MFKVDDIVVVTVDSPAGVEVDVKGDIGIITEVTEIQGEKEYLVHTTFSSHEYGFVYVENEIRLATDEEVRKKLTESLRAYHAI